MRSVDEIKSSIKELMEKAENSFEDLDNNEDLTTETLSKGSNTQNFDSLPNEIKEEIKKEFDNFQNAFKNQDIDGIIAQSIRDTIKSVLDEWLKINLPSIVRDVVDEKINKLTANKK